MRMSELLPVQGWRDANPPRYMTNIARRGNIALLMIFGIRIPVLAQYPVTPRPRSLQHFGIAQ
jgi:hypothetical protein